MIERLYEIKNSLSPKKRSVASRCGDSHIFNWRLLLMELTPRTNSISDIANQFVTSWKCLATKPNNKSLRVKKKKRKRSLTPDEVVPRWFSKRGVLQFNQSRCRSLLTQESLWRLRKVNRSPFVQIAVNTISQVKTYFDACLLPRSTDRITKIISLTFIAVIYLFMLAQLSSRLSNLHLSTHPQDIFHQRKKR